MAIEFANPYKYKWTWRCAECGTVIHTRTGEVPWCRHCGRAYDFVEKED